ncbi:hypothetical protein J31TS6_04170 [Brevibacillus reuszeri]|uniref:hypothetical protein n=1 Tax=Brevibacillus reuszeri TaxID=54915 RepID=UPI001AFDCD9F|nr:hypothetical protein [Brevibacillus reuszeri]GIO04389.1 hypothetical protein J31TS6_04170 [Brevibacillus reuszeri]
MGGSRFWEFYLVRYLLGTIFGVIILFYLVTNYNSQISAAFYNNPNANIKSELFSFLFSTSYDVNVSDANVISKALGSEQLFANGSVKIVETGFPILAAIILVVAGFLYMYFSSMIILILHGVRSILFMYSWPNNIKVSLLLLVTTVSIVVFAFLQYYGIAPFKHIIALFIMFICFFVLALHFPAIETFYKKLSSFRTKDKEKEDDKVWKECFDNNYKQITVKADREGLHIHKFSKESVHDERKDYIESYKHLREHGNAFGIIVCEILFAFWLVMWDFSFWAIFYWCLIGFSAWVLGSYLEISRVEKE